jgi:hypothetical protein
MMILLDVFVQSDDPLLINDCRLDWEFVSHEWQHEPMEPEEPSSISTPTPSPLVPLTGAEASNKKLRAWYFNLGLVFMFFILALMVLLLSVFDVTQILTIVLPGASVMISGPVLTVSFLRPGALGRLSNQDMSTT